MLVSLQAVDDMNGKELNGRQVYVGRAQKKGERQNELKRKFEQMKQDRMTRYQVSHRNIHQSRTDNRFIVLITTLLWKNIVSLRLVFS